VVLTPQNTRFDVNENKRMSIKTWNEYISRAGGLYPTWYAHRCIIPNAVSSGLERFVVSFGSEPSPLLAFHRGAPTTITSAILDFIIWPLSWLKLQKKKNESIPLTQFYSNRSGSCTISISSHFNSVQSGDSMDANRLNDQLLSHFPFLITYRTIHATRLSLNSVSIWFICVTITNGGKRHRL
jgi:hypothetical protein